MSNTEIVQAFIAAWCSADWDTVSALTTDDLTFGNDADFVDKSGLLAYGQDLLSAFPDLALNSRGFREEGDKVYVTSNITGTNTGTITRGPDLPPVPPTGKRIDLPPEEEVFIIRGTQISHLAITAAPDAAAIMSAQLGVPLG